MHGISKLGDGMLRTALVGAGIRILANVRQPSALRTWGCDYARRKGTMKAAVAIARRLAAILHRMWIDGTEFEPGIMSQPAKG